MNKYVLGIGGINLDLIITSDNEFKMHDSNPSTIKYTSGGVMRNILENLARLDENTILLSSIGNDEFGKILVNKSKDIGINMDYLYINNNVPTSMYCAFMNNHGDMEVGASDMKILDLIPLTYFDSLKELYDKAEIIIIDANYSAEKIGYILNLIKHKTIYCDPVSASKAIKLKPFLKYIHTIKPNALELESLSGMKCDTKEEIIKAADHLVKQGVKEVIVSLGENGVYYASNKIKFFKAFKKYPMVNATGAGDSFFAGFIKARLNNMPVIECLEYGLAAGIIAINSAETISQDINIKNILKIIKENK